MALPPSAEKERVRLGLTVPAYRKMARERFQTTCHDTGKHDGEIKRRRVIYFNGVEGRELHSHPQCDRHYRKDLREMVKRGETAAAALARLESTRKRS